MKDSPKRALAEAEEWLRTAELALKDARKECELANVACAEAIHALIRANDALTLHFLDRKGTRHDDAPFLFLRLVTEKKIVSEDETFADLLMKAMRFKSRADYGGGILLFPKQSTLSRERKNSFPKQRSILVDVVCTIELKSAESF